MMDSGVKKKAEGLIDKIKVTKIPFYIHNNKTGMLATFKGRQPDFIVVIEDEKLYITAKNGETFIKNLQKKKSKKAEDIQDVQDATCD